MSANKHPADVVEVRHNAAENRYEIALGADLAVAEYTREGNRLVLTHTFVPPSLRGRGLAEKLVRRALDDAMAQKLGVVPACSYVERFIRLNPAYQPLVVSS